MQLGTQRLLQALAGVLCVAAFVYSSALDHLTSRTWDHCKASAAFRHDTWEPGLVIVLWPIYTTGWCVSVLFCEHTCVTAYVRTWAKHEPWQSKIHTAAPVHRYVFFFRCSCFQCSVPSHCSCESLHSKKRFLHRSLVHSGALLRTQVQKGNGSAF